MPSPTRLRSALAALLVASAVLFGLAARAERSSERRAEPAAIGGEGSEAREAAEVHGETRVERPETLFGVRTESAATTAVVIVALVVAAAAVVTRPRPVVLAVVAAVVLALAALDGREALLQSRESRAGLVAAAGLLTLAHLACAGLALLAARRAEVTPSR